MAAELTKEGLQKTFCTAECEKQQRGREAQTLFIQTDYIQNNDCSLSAWGAFAHQLSSTHCIYIGGVVSTPQLLVKTADVQQMEGF